MTDLEKELLEALQAFATFVEDDHKEDTHEHLEGKREYCSICNAIAFARAAIAKATGGKP